MQALVLGTAQWGNAYGVTNSHGRLDDHQIAEIATLALDSGIKYADTAAGYGDAELRLAPWAQQFEVTTKVVGSGPISVEAQLATSLVTLGLETVRCCLIHDWPSLTQDQAEAAVNGLERAKARGVVSKIGISGYDEVDLIRALNTFSELSAVQVPVSILDQRLVGSLAVDRLKATGTEIQARSVFLQGLLLARNSSTLGQHADVLNFHRVCEDSGMDPLSVAIHFVREVSWVSQIVVGLTSARELREIVETWNSQLDFDAERFSASNDTSLIDPRMW